MESTNQKGTSRECVESIYMNYGGYLSERGARPFEEEEEEKYKQRVVYGPFSYLKHANS